MSEMEIVNTIDANKLQPHVAIAIANEDLRQSLIFHLPVGELVESNGSIKREQARK
jgi:hypothetical protein